MESGRDRDVGPRATVALPGVTSIRYGLAASTPSVGSSNATAPCRRNAGPATKTATAGETDAGQRHREAAA